jgi:hypothetical protein
VGTWDLSPGHSRSDREARFGYDVTVPDVTQVPGAIGARAPHAEAAQAPGVKPGAANRHVPALKRRADLFRGMRGGTEWIWG